MPLIGKRGEMRYAKMRGWMMIGRWHTWSGGKIARMMELGRGKRILKCRFGMGCIDSEYGEIHS